MAKKCEILRMSKLCLYAGNAGADANRLHGYPRCYRPCSGCATLVLFFAGGVTFLYSAYHTNRRADR